MMKPLIGFVVALVLPCVADAQPAVTYTVTTPAPAITISIPASPVGSHLRIRVMGASDAPYEHVSVGLQINGDTGQNYGWAWDSAIGGVPPGTSVSSGGDDEWRARVGLVPGAGLLVPHAAGEVDIVIPQFRGTDFLRLIRFDGGESLGITRSIRVSGHAAYYANKSGGGGGTTESDITALGSVIYSGTYFSGQGPANAFSGANAYYSGISSSQPSIGRDFGSPQTISKISARGAASFSFVGRVRYSDDGVSFTSTATIVSISPGDNVWRDFVVSAGAHRYWVIADQQDDAYHQIDDLKFSALTSGGSGPGPFGGTYGTNGSFTSPEPVTSVTLLLDVGNWVAGSVMQVYIED